jgi:predicted  nucleic acid-binding Zn-ribbon protein|tara:strand:- start:694 stop:927 length:234 start_codon:yes stop_codon:yes gene_type:complete
LKVKEETESKMRSEITTLEKELEKEITDLNNLNDLAQKKSNTEIVSLNEQIKTLEDQIVKINQKEEQYKQQIKKYEE